MIITAVERKPRTRRVNVFIDGQFALAIGAELAAEREVRSGRSITADELSALSEAEARRSALRSALRLLSYRSRSERELRDRLARKKYGQTAIDTTVSRLREIGYLDDTAFARLWTETRQASRPRSRRLLVGELRRRGIAQSTAEEATAEISDEDEAYQAANRRLRSLQGLQYGRFRERLGGILTRRGFSYDVSRRTIDRCWQELTQEAEAQAES